MRNRECGKIPGLRKRQTEEKKQRQKRKLALAITEQVIPVKICDHFELFLKFSLVSRFKSIVNYLYSILK